MKIKENLDKLEILSDIYFDLAKNKYRNKRERDIAVLKMKLVKKEMLLLSYLVDRDIIEFDKF
jgi:hypothetical protein